jgi:hypothetical protein
VPTPGACEFCGHRKLSEGICQCPPDCPSCHQGCCGQILLLSKFMRDIAPEPGDITIDV